MKKLYDRIVEFVSEGPEMSQEEIDTAISENIRMGYMLKNADGTFSLTELGKKHAEFLLSRPEDGPAQ